MIRRLACAVVVAVLCAGVAGCVPEPVPTPSPTGFATEEEAFAAAEQTYRAYVDALNQVDLSDPETFEAVYAWTTGDLNASDREGLTRYHADQVTVGGQSRITLVEPAADIPNLAVCLDVSDVTVVSADGSSLVAPDRTDVQSLMVHVTPSADSPTGTLISAISGREGVPTCDD